VKIVWRFEEQFTHMLLRRHFVPAFERMVSGRNVSLVASGEVLIPMLHKQLQVYRFQVLTEIPSFLTDFPSYWDG
jgi:hypothetical protein